MRLMDTFRKVAVIMIYHSRFTSEYYRDPATGRIPEFGTYQAAHDYITRHGLPAGASAVELYTDRDQAGPLILPH